MIAFSPESFWKEYPSDEEKFDQCVREGIYIWNRNYEGSGIQPDYNGVSSSKLERYYPAWKENREEFSVKRPQYIVKALKAFEKDYEKLGIREVLRYASLPTAPEGYNWEKSYGGIQFGDGDNYCLWNDKLGYMPASE